MSRNNSRPNDDPFEFVKEEVKSIKLFVDLTATANLREFEVYKLQFLVI